MTPLPPLLSGVRILDLTRMLAGPYGSQLLADMGAEVIKIETKEGDPMRQMGPHFVQGESAYFLSSNRNKKRLTLNLKSAEGQQIFFDLVAQSDVVFENFRPGVMERLGFDYDSLKAIKPDIILCSISGYGQNGPRREQPAFDLALQALGGGMSITGEPDQAPVRMGLPIGDLAGGMFGVMAVTAALHRRAQTGQGARLDISLFDGQVSLLTYMAQYYFISGEVPRPWGAQHENVVPYNAFATSDGYLVIAAFVGKFWVNLCRALELTHLTEDPRFITNATRRQHRDALNSLLADVFQSRSTADWMARLQEAGVPANPIQQVDEVLADPQVEARQMRLTLEHPTIGPLEMVGHPIKVADTKDPLVAPPLLSQHTTKILTEVLGYSAEKVAILRKTGIV